MTKVKWIDDEDKVDFIPIFMIGFEEDFVRGVILTMPAYEFGIEEDDDFALFAIDAAVDMLMQKRDKLEKRELH